MRFQKYIRRHLLMLACLMAVSILSVYVAKTIHAWQVEQEMADGGVSHDTDNCGICHFTLGASTEAQTIELHVCLAPMHLSFDATPTPLMVVAVSAYEGRGPPAGVS